MIQVNLMQEYNNHSKLMTSTLFSKISDMLVDNEELEDKPHVLCKEIVVLQDFRLGGGQ